MKQSTYRIVKCNYITPSNYIIRPEYIIKQVCSYFYITEKKITSKDRHRNIVTARMLAMYFIYKRCPEQTLSSIGRMFGNRDHTTVINAKNTAIQYIYGPTPIWKEHHDYFDNLFN